MAAPKRILENESPSQDEASPVTPTAELGQVGSGTTRTTGKSMGQKGKGQGNGKKGKRKGSVPPSKNPKALASAKTSKRPSAPPTSSRPSGIQISTSSARPAEGESPVAPEALEVKIPPPAPVGDIEESFFSQPQLPVVDAHPHEDDVRLQHPKMTAAAHARRAHLSRYVKWTVACAGALCALALVRVSLSGAAKGLPANAAEPPRANVAATPPAPQPEPVAPPAAAKPENAPAAEAKPEAKDEAPKPADPKPAEPAAPQAAAPSGDVPAPAAAAAPAADGKTAAQEKKDAKSALERGRIADAIDSGERAVALDPTDGESWLVLGAAYQEKGKIADARRCFTACVKQGKKGPIGECSAMLR